MGEGKEHSAATAPGTQDGQYDSNDDDGDDHDHGDIWASSRREVEGALYSRPRRLRWTEHDVAPGQTGDHERAARPATSLLANPGS
jgi:hypothetical protein